MTHNKPDFAELSLRVINQRLDGLSREIKIKDRDYMSEKESRDQDFFNLMCFVTIMTVISVFISGYAIYCIFSPFN